MMPVIERENQMKQRAICLAVIFSMYSLLPEHAAAELRGSYSTEVTTSFGTQFEECLHFEGNGSVLAEHLDEGTWFDVDFFIFSSWEAEFTAVNDPNFIVTYRGFALFSLLHFAIGGTSDGDTFTAFGITSSCPPFGGGVPNPYMPEPPQ